MSQSHTRFHIGQVVHHRKYDYRGVIVSADPVFRGSEEWYELVAKSRPPKDQPWYQVLPDGAEHRTYVAERHLEADSRGEQIEHPELGQFFKAFRQGQYIPK